MHNSRNLFQTTVIIDGAEYLTVPCKTSELEEGGHYFMYFDSVNYIVQIENNPGMERTIIVPKFVYGDIDNKELYISSKWIFVRNNHFMEIPGPEDHMAPIFYKCEYLLNHDNVLNIDMDFSPNFI